MEIHQLCGQIFLVVTNLVKQFILVKSVTIRHRYFVTGNL